MSDIQYIYSVLLSRGFQHELFALPNPKREGKETVGECPFCGSKRFSYPTRGEEPVWRCWACDKAGDWLEYLQEAQSLNFREALQYLADRAGVKLEGSGEWKARYEEAKKAADVLEAAHSIFRQSLLGSYPPEWDYLSKDRGYSWDDIHEMSSLGSWSRGLDLKPALEHKGFSEEDMEKAGLLTQGFGETHGLTILWRDGAGRPVGLTCRSLLSDEELKEKGLQKYKNARGFKKSEGLLGFSDVRGSEELVLVEGILDALYLNAKGFKAVAVGGTSLSASQLKLLEDTGTEELVLAMDSDEAGQAATEKILQSLKTSRLRASVVAWPEGIKDADELLREQGKEAMEEVLKKAISWPRWTARRLIPSEEELKTDRGVDGTISRLAEEAAGMEDAIHKRFFLTEARGLLGVSKEELAHRLEAYESKAYTGKAKESLKATLSRLQKAVGEGDISGAEVALEDGLVSSRLSRGIRLPEPYSLHQLREDALRLSDGLKTGWQDLDKLITVPAGALTIVAGRPGHGKTSFLLNLLKQWSGEYPDKAFWYFSYEESCSRLSLKLIMILAGQVLDQRFNLDAYLGYLKGKRAKDEVVEKAIQDFDTLTASGRVGLVAEYLTAEDLAATIRLLGQRKNLGGIIVDYLQKVPVRESQSMRYLEIKKTSSLLLEEAKALDCPIVLGAQLSREARGKGKGQEPDMADLGSLRESGDIEQDAALVLGLYNKASDTAEEGQVPDVDLRVTVLKARHGQPGDFCYLKFHRPILTLRTITSVF